MHLSASIISTLKKKICLPQFNEKWIEITAYPCFRLISYQIYNSNLICTNKAFKSLYVLVRY